MIAQIAISVAAIYALASTDRLDYYNKAYGAGQSEITQSSGATIHILLNAMPASWSWLVAMSEGRSSLLSCYRLLP